MSKKVVSDNSSLMGKTFNELPPELQEFFKVEAEENLYVDILDFVERGLKQPLFPVQRLTLKLCYGLELDDTEKTIRICDKFGDTVYEMLTELEYFYFLVEAGRVNLKEPPTKPLHQIVLVVGRRGSKSTMSTFVTAYELYRLLYVIKDPHQKYPITHNSDIRITFVSKTKNQAAEIFNQVRSISKDLPDFKEYLEGSTAERVRFYTPGQLDRYEREGILPKTQKGLLSMVVAASNSQNVRGPGCYALVMDEFAHFVNDSKVQSDSVVWDALTPSVASFNLDARIMCISSPWAKSGKFYELYDKGMQGIIPNMLVLNIPTWGINPSIEPEYFKTQYATMGHTSYMCEFGAQFSDSKYAWIEDSTLVSNAMGFNYIPPRLGKRHVRYFWGLDLAQKNDAFAVTVTHKEDDKYFVDYQMDYFASEKERAAIRNMGFLPVTRYDLTQQPISYPQNPDVMADELKALSLRFPPTLALLDQWSGLVFQHIFKTRGLNNIEVKHFSDTQNSNNFRYFYTQLSLGNIVLPDNDYFADQLLNLEANKRANGIVMVEAPTMAGRHDDLFDSLVRAIYAHVYFYTAGAGKKHVANPSSGTGMKRMGQSAVNYNAYQAHKRLQHRTGQGERRF